MIRLQYYNYSRTVWLIFILVISCGAAAASHVVLLTERKLATKEGHSAQRELMVISETGQKQITVLSRRLLFGKDDSTLVILDYQGQPKQWNMHIIDRATATLVVKKSLTNFPATVLINDCEEKIVVRSEDSMVCVPTYDSEQGTGFAYVNWKGEVRLDSKPYKGLKTIRSVFPVPSGHGVSFDDWSLALPKPKLALFDVINHKFRLLSLPDATTSARDQFVFLQSVGLVQYHNAALFRLSNASAETNTAEPERIPIIPPDSQIFPCSVKGTPCLVWGRNPNPESKFGDVSEIVIYDFNAKRELMCQPLGTTTSTFRMDPSGSKLYFLDVEQQQIRAIDIEKKVIVMLADLEKAKMPDPESAFAGVSFRTILDAY